eukprot:TRINITY_DN3912_c0_g4_i1.p1 TRINITY_DN3912_c0_g4~~TRINITY_DN3912_c0_g4_i1.p1  ORF type:complete len:124 (+),score=16.21 TRINITY_DN3912_c0_g4_i1:175-546(+)
MQDFFALVPQDIYRLIFGFCTFEDQFSLSRTCKRLHSMKWMESIWKRESMKRYEQLVPFSTKMFEMGIDLIGISWSNVLECFLRSNKKTNSSFRRYRYDYERGDELYLTERIDYSVILIPDGE